MSRSGMSDVLLFERASSNDNEGAPTSSGKLLSKVFNDFEGGEGEG